MPVQLSPLAWSLIIILVTAVPAGALGFLLVRTARSASPLPHWSVRVEADARNIQLFTSTRPWPRAEEF